MAKRFGTISTKVEATANQLLRLNAAGTEFEFANPATIPAYTITNCDTDRAIDGLTTTEDELVDVLGTLIQDLQNSLSATGSSPTIKTFVSQSYTHTVSDAGTVYTLDHNLGSTPDSIICQILDEGVWKQILSGVEVNGSSIYGVAYVNTGWTTNRAKVALC